MLRSQYLLELHGILFCLLTLLVFFLRRQKSQNSELIAAAVGISAIDLFWDMMAYSQQGVMTEYAFSMHMIANFFLYSLEYLEFFLLQLYIFRTIRRYAGKGYKILYRVPLASEIILEVLLLLNFSTGCYFYFDEANYYHRGPLFMVSVASHALIMSISVYLVWKHRQQMPRYITNSMLFYELFPILGMLLQTVFFGFSFFNIAVTMAVIVFFVCNIHEINYDNRRKQELLMNTQASLIGAQMNPHFVFNTLGVIRYLIQEDPEIAEEALVHFSSYLRHTITVDPNKGLVALNEEIQLAREYAYMEQLRFGDQIQVEFDINDSDMEIPYMTIEPLVENAIKHGLRKRVGAGKVLVKTWRDALNNNILIQDDGVGFNPEHIEKSKDGAGIGLTNVRDRIRLLCNGTLNIRSEVGKGTSILIRIPCDA